MCFCTREEKEAEGSREEKTVKGSSLRMVSVSICVENIKEPELVDS